MVSTRYSSLQTTKIKSKMHEHTTRNDTVLILCCGRTQLPRQLCGQLVTLFSRGLSSALRVRGCPDDIVPALLAVQFIVTLTTKDFSAVTFSDQNNPQSNSGANHSLPKIIYFHNDSLSPSCGRSNRSPSILLPPRRLPHHPRRPLPFHHHLLTHRNPRPPHQP